MIHLEVQDYCQNCDDFEPVKASALHVACVAGGATLETFVRCENEKRCKQIYERIVKEQESVEKDKDGGVDITISCSNDLSPLATAFKKIVDDTKERMAGIGK